MLFLFCVPYLWGMKLKDWNTEERPREKLLLKGPGALGNAELLACENGVYTIGMTNGFTRDWAEQRLSGTIEKILSGLAAATEAKT